MARLPKVAEAQCTQCGEFFGSDSAFFAHQKVNYRAKRRENVVKCLNPAKVNRSGRRLVFDEARAVWRWDGGDERGPATRAA
jgi:hypothetical protein